MRIHKKVLNRESEVWLLCCWDTCEKPGYELYKVIQHASLDEDVCYVFCTERHKQYWLHSHIRYGALPSGVR